jgi:hypothetical protein
MDVTLYPDEDWTVSVVHSVDRSGVYFTGPDGSEVRIEAAYSVLAELARRWVNEMGVEANGRNPDLLEYNPLSVNFPTVTETSPILGKIDEKIDNLEKLLTERNGGDDARYPADMVVGDWVRFPPSHAWRKIDRIYENEFVYYLFGGVTYEQRVRASVRYPYCTAARFAEVCDR